MTDEDSLQHLAGRRCLRHSFLPRRHSRRTACRIVECPHFTPTTSGRRTPRRRRMKWFFILCLHDYSLLLSNRVPLEFQHGRKMTEFPECPPLWFYWCTRICGIYDTTVLSEQCQKCLLASGGALLYHFGCASKFSSNR